MWTLRRTKWFLPEQRDWPAMVGGPLRRAGQWVLDLPRRSSADENPALAGALAGFLISIILVGFVFVLIVAAGFTILGLGGPPPKRVLSAEEAGRIYSERTAPPLVQPHWTDSIVCIESDAFNLICGKKREIPDAYSQRYGVEGRR